MLKYLPFLAWLILLLSLSACQGATADQPTLDSPAEPARASQLEPTAAGAAAPEASQPQPSPAPTNTSGPTPTPTEIVPYVQTVGSFLAIHEIGLGPEGYIALTNFTNVPVTTKGLYLCQGEDCFALPEAVIEPDATARVAVGDGEGLDGVIATKATIGALKPTDGEVALFASDQFDDPKALLIYLQWGSTPHALTDLAVEAGLWIKTGYAPTSEKATRLYRIEESGWWIFEEAAP